MIQDKLKGQINEAMKARDEVRVSTLRMLSSALHNAKIDNPDMSEEDELKVVNSEAKKRKDAIEAYEKVAANEKADQERKELAVLEEYLPEQMSDGEIRAVVIQVIEQTGAKSMEDLGKVMGEVMSKVDGKADGTVVSKVVREKLS